MVIGLLLAANLGRTAAVAACSDKTKVPEGKWVFYNLSSTSLPAGCDVPLQSQAPAECCTSSAATFTQFAGLAFEDIVRANNNDTCAVIPEFGNADWYSQCNADGSIMYGEECNADCNSCDLLGTYKAGCYAAASFPGSKIFMHTMGCACNEDTAGAASKNNSGSSSPGDACPDKTKVPEGKWVLYNLSVTTLPKGCVVPLGLEAPAECCTSSSATFTQFAGLAFEDIVRANSNGTCAVIPEFGNADWYSECKADGSIGYGEDCDANCNSCALMGTYKAGCYAATSFPGAAIFMHTTGCACNGASLPPSPSPLPSSSPSPPAEDTLTCADLQGIYKDSGCCGIPGKTVEKDDLNLTCGDLQGIYKGAGCCGTPGKTVSDRRLSSAKIR